MSADERSPAQVAAARSAPPAKKGVQMLVIQRAGVCVDVGLLQPSSQMQTANQFVARASVLARVDLCACLIVSVSRVPRADHMRHRAALRRSERCVFVRARDRALNVFVRARPKSVTAGGDDDEEEDDVEDVEDVEDEEEEEEDADADAGDNEEDDDHEEDDVNADDDGEDDDGHSHKARRRGSSKKPPKKKSKKQLAEESDIAAAAGAVAARTDELTVRKQKLDKVAVKKKTKKKTGTWPLTFGIVTKVVEGARVNECVLCKKKLLVYDGSNSKVRLHYKKQHPAVQEELDGLQASRAAQGAFADVIAAARPKTASSASSATATTATTAMAAPTAGVKATPSATASGARALVDLTAQRPAGAAPKLTDYYHPMQVIQDKVCGVRGGGVCVERARLQDKFNGRRKAIGQLIMHISNAVPLNVADDACEWCGVRVLITSSGSISGVDRAPRRDQRVALEARSTRDARVPRIQRHPTR
jgi:hypothetical protein